MRVRPVRCPYCGAYASMNVNSWPIRYIIYSRQHSIVSDHENQPKATCVVKMIHMKMGREGYVFGSSLSVLRNLKCTAYTSRLITDVPTKAINDIYRLFGIECPEAIDFTSEGGLILESERKKENGRKAAAGNKDVPKRKPGRPKGSLNRKTLERMRLEEENPPVKRRPGRPKGSKNKKEKDNGK